MTRCVQDIIGHHSPAMSAHYTHIEGEAKRQAIDYVINQAWTLQRRGEVPSGGMQQVNDFQNRLAAFEPATEGQKLLHGETLRAFSHMIEARRLRLDASSQHTDGSRLAASPG